MQRTLSCFWLATNALSPPQLDPSMTETIIVKTLLFPSCLLFSHSCRDFFVIFSTPINCDQHCLLISPLYSRNTPTFFSPRCDCPKNSLKMVSSKPEFIMIPGAWHGPESFGPTTALLEKAGYTVHALQLPSVGASPPLESFDPDGTSPHT